MPDEVEVRTDAQRARRSAARQRDQDARRSGSASRRAGSVVPAVDAGRGRHLSPEPRQGATTSDVECSPRATRNPDLPETFVDYDDKPREYVLKAVTTVSTCRRACRISTASPSIRSRSSCAPDREGQGEAGRRARQQRRVRPPQQRRAVACASSTRAGAPTPDDLDELIARVWKEPAFFLAHPRAIAAFGRECTRRGVPPPTVTLFGSPFLTWRGLPLVPCDKLHVERQEGNDRSC